MSGAGAQTCAWVVLEGLIHNLVIQSFNLSTSFSLCARDVLVDLRVRSSQVSRDSPVVSDGLDDDGEGDNGRVFLLYMWARGKMKTSEFVVL